MNYDVVVIKLREKIETLQRENTQLKDEAKILSDKTYTLQQENAQLKDEAKILTNKAYTLQQVNTQLKDETTISANEIYTLQQENTQLRDEIALLSNENYTLKCDGVLVTAEVEKGRVQKQEKIDLTKRLEQMEQELAFIQGSNTYKIWMKYRRLPEPIRKVLRGIFTPIKMIYKSIKRVFR